MVATAAQITRLRRLLDDRLPATEDDSEAFWTDQALSDLFDEAGGIMMKTALLGWEEKAAHFSSLIDRNESGSDIKLSQKFRQAAGMRDYYQKQWSDSGGNNVKGRIGVVARVASLDDSDDFLDGDGWPYDFVAAVGDENVRMFPTKRFPSILR